MTGGGSTGTTEICLYPTEKWFSMRLLCGVNPAGLLSTFITQKRDR